MRKPTLAKLIASCEREARANGFAGKDWEPTAADLEWVTDQLRHKPSREEWAAAGYPHVGGRHVARPTGRPSLSGKGDTASFPVRLPAPLVCRVKTRATLLGISRAELVRRALEAFLG